MSTRVWNLERISKNYPLVLVDTCALISPIGYWGFEAAEKSVDFFDKKFKEIDGMSVTKSVLEEYSRGINSSRRRRFTDELKHKILQLDGGERLWYKELYESYSGVGDKFEVGGIDIDFLLSGIVVCEARKTPVALISNDTKMIRPWKFLLIGACLTAKEVGFFVRKGEDIFKTTKLPRK